MKFTHTGNYHSGHTTASVVLDNIRFGDLSKMTYRTLCRMRVLDAEERDIDKSKKLEIDWNYTILYDGNSIFNFTTHERFHLTETESKPSIYELKEVIKITFSFLKRAFEERRKEFNLFDPIAEIDEDNLEQLALQLEKELLLEPTKK